MTVLDYMLVGKLIGAVILMVIAMIIYVEWWLHRYDSPSSDEEIERRRWGGKYD
jgi:ethanolamine transporter EutH